MSCEDLCVEEYFYGISHPHKCWEKPNLGRVVFSLLQNFPFHKEKDFFHKAVLKYLYYQDYPMRINALYKI